MAENHDPLVLLSEQLNSIKGSGPEDQRLKLDIIDRMAKYQNDANERRSRLAETASSQKQSSIKTHFIIALVGLITIAGNSAVSYILKRQESTAAQTLAATNADLAASNTRLQNQLEEAKSQNNQVRANETRALEFQYTMIDKIMSKESPDPDNSESTRAKQIAFLYKMGLMDRIAPEGFKRLYENLVGEKLDDSKIGFPTLPTVSATDVPIGSKLTRASTDDLVMTLGPPVKDGCQPRMATVAVPFMTVVGPGEGPITEVQIHEALAPYLRAAFDIIVQRNLQDDARLFGGILSDPKHRPRVSFHNWAAAIDFIPSTGIRGKGSLQLALAMEDAGFRSSGLATNDDWSHFEVSKEVLQQIADGGYKPSVACK